MVDRITENKKRVVMNRDKQSTRPVRVASFTVINFIRLVRSSSWTEKTRRMLSLSKKATQQPVYFTFTTQVVRSTTSPYTQSATLGRRSSLTTPLSSATLQERVNILSMTVPSFNDETLGQASRPKQNEANTSTNANMILELKLPPTTSIYRHSTATCLPTLSATVVQREPLQPA